MGIVHRAGPMWVSPGYLEMFWHPFWCLSVSPEPEQQGRWVCRVPDISSGCA